MPGIHQLQNWCLQCLVRLSCSLATLVIGFEDWICVLIASVPGLCILFNYNILSKDASRIMSKTDFYHVRKQRRRSAYRKADLRLCFHYTDSTLPILSEISSL